MAALKNPRWEAFSQRRAKGESASRAYVGAGYKKNDSNAARLNGNEQVAARIAELQGKAAKRVIAGVEDVLGQQWAIGTFEVTDIMSWPEFKHASGLVIKASKAWPERARRAVQSVRVSPVKDSDLPSLEFKFHGKTEVLRDVGRHMGMYAGKFDEKLLDAVEELLEGVRERVPEDIYERLVLAFRAQMGEEEMATS